MRTKKYYNIEQGTYCKVMYDEHGQFIRLSRDYFSLRAHSLRFARELGYSLGRFIEGFI